MTIPRPLRLGAMQAASFALVTLNFRLVARGSTVGAVGSDVAIMLVGWTLFKTMQAASTWQDRVGFLIGGALGSTLSMMLTGGHI